MCQFQEEGALELGTPQFESRLKVFDTFYVRSSRPSYNKAQIVFYLTAT